MPDPNIIRWGLLSTAHINRRLIPAIRSSSRGKLIAVASRDGEKAKVYADQWKIPYAFDSYQAMLDSDLVDAVYISLPNHLHAEWSMRAMQAGKHVLCEKPFAITLAEVDQMIETGQKYQRVIAEAFMYIHHPQTKMVKEWIQSGRLGDISLVRSSFDYILTDKEDVRLVPEFGGGSLWDVGVYPLSFAQYIYCGPPLRVNGVQTSGSTGIDETFIGQMVYPSASNHEASGSAQIASSFRTPFYITAEVIGTGGRLALNKPFTGLDNDRHMVFYPPEGEPYEIDVPHQDLYLGEVEDMHSAILDGRPTYLSLKQTRNHIRTVLALYESARTQTTVYLNKT